MAFILDTLSDAELKWLLMEEEERFKGMVAELERRIKALRAALQQWEQWEPTEADLAYLKRAAQPWTAQQSLYVFALEQRLREAEAHVLEERLKGQGVLR